MHRKTGEIHEDRDQQEISPTPGRLLRNLAFRWTFLNSKHDGTYVVGIYRELPRKTLGMSDSEELGRLVSPPGGQSETRLCRRVELRDGLLGDLSTI